MVNCRKTIAIMVCLAAAVFSISSAFAQTGLPINVTATTKADKAHNIQMKSSTAAQRNLNQDPAVAKKAEAEAKCETYHADHQPPTKKEWPADAKKAPEHTKGAILSTPRSIYLTEDFEGGVVPPAGWSEIISNADYNWKIQTFPFEGAYCADVEYDPDLTPPQDEWLVSPVLDLTGATPDIRVEYRWAMSYYWGVDPYDNYNLELWISTDAGETFPDKLWDESAQGVFTSWAWNKAVVSLSAYAGNDKVVLAWRYVGVDGAEALVDLINVTDDAPPELGAGNTCEDPVKAEFPADLPYTNGNTTCGRGNDYSGTCLSPFDGGEDIIYEITVTDPVVLNITLDPLGTDWTGFSISDVCPPGGSCIAATANPGANPYGITCFSLEPGTYYLMIDTWPAPDCIPEFNLSIEEGPAAQPGDNCSDPLKIDLPPLPYSDLNQTTCGRCDNYAGTCLAPFDGGEDIIYEINVASPIIVDITLDPHGTAYSGMVLDDVCPPGSSGCIDMSTNCNITKHSMTSVVLAPGTYYLMIDTWPAPNCIPSFDLTITEGNPPPPPPDNDDWANAEKIDDVTDLQFCTDNATFDGPGVCQDCPNVWYCYTASCDGKVTADLCGSSYDTKIAVYDGCEEPTLGNEIACNDDFCDLQSRVQFLATAGHTYLIEVGGFHSICSGCHTGCGDLSVGCALLCQVQCPNGATDEGEPCGTDVNGGCNSNFDNPPYGPVQCGETICGNAWFDGGTRDTDWFKFTLNGYFNVTWKVQAEFQALVGFLETTVPGSTACANLTGYLNPYALSDECQEVSVTTLLGPGDYIVFVAPQFSNVIQCANGPWDYWASLTCEPAQPTYCGASGGICDEYISNVTVGTINNSSLCSNYADYSALSTTMDVGSPYPIAVANGFPYAEDQCGIWVDWNQDADFSDPNETIAVAGNPGLGPYTGSITPPTGALPGPTRMRVRITWVGAVSPCGTTNYGEVEDYTINVNAGGCSGPTKTKMDPDPIYQFYAYAINPLSGHAFLGGVINGHCVEDIDLGSLMINGNAPSAAAIEPSHPGFTGQVLDATFDLRTFILGYGALYDESVQPYHVTGQFSDASFFDVTGMVTWHGHTSGDVNLDGKANVQDLTFLISYIFRGGPAPTLSETADVNGDNVPANILDLTYFVNFMFRGGPALTHH